MRNLFALVERSIFSAFAVMMLFDEHSIRKEVITSFNKSGLISSMDKSASNCPAFLVNSNTAFSGSSSLQMLSSALNPIGFES